MSEFVPQAPAKPRTLLLMLRDVWQAVTASPHGRVDQGAANLITAAVVFAASVPYAGWMLPSGWLIGVGLVMIGERAWDARRRGFGPSAERVNPFSWTVNAGYATAASYLAIFHIGPAQTLGVTLFGVVLFQILARDYDNPRRLATNLVAPLALILLVQAGAVFMALGRAQPWQIVTLFASPYVVFRIFRSIHAQLNHSRELERRALTKLSLSETRYRLVAEASPDVIVRYDTEGRLEYLSAAARAYGWDPDHAVGSTFTALHPDEQARNATFLHDLARGERMPQGRANRWRAVTCDGRTVTFEGRSSPIIDDDGHVRGAVAVLRDVTESQALEAELAASEQKLRGLFELAPLGIALTSMDGRYLEFNDAFCEICGYEAEELRALNYWALTPERFMEDEQRQLELLGRTGRYGPYEKEYIRKDGTLVPLRLNGMLVDGPDGEPVIWSIVEDISAQRRNEQVLIEAREAAEAAAKAKSEFLANMSHEIRTPLTAVIGFADLLKTMDGLPAAARQHVDRIGASAEALRIVVNDVLDISKFEAGKIDLDPHPFEAPAFFEAAADIVRGQAAAKGLALTVEIEPEMPDWLMADAGRLRQVVLNLLTNAVKFTDAGRVTMNAGYDASTGRLSVSVTDTGIGIGKAQAKRLFQRFSQVDASSTRRHGGTGLGLAISKAIVEGSGGQIGVDSTPGTGSSFWFWVPAPVSGPIGAPGAEQRVGDTASGAHVLVVDDVAMNRDLISAMLGALDIELSYASGGLEAVEAARKTRFDLILMDVQMPGMDGMEAARAIRAGPSANGDTPILAVSANVMADQIEACLAAGMDGHIAKPISATDLLTKTVEWAGRPHEANQRPRAAS